jgi:hypothetical protein
VKIEDEAREAFRTSKQRISTHAPVARRVDWNASALRGMEALNFW